MNIIACQVFHCYMISGRRPIERKDRGKRMNVQEKILVMLCALASFSTACSAEEEYWEPEEADDADLLEDDEYINDLTDIDDSEEAASFCIGYEHTNYGGQSITFNYPRDYNDLHRKPSFGDKISSIQCYGASLRVFEHSQWAGASLTISGWASISNLHAYGMGDKISSVLWVGEDNFAGQCTLYEHKNYQGSFLSVSRRRDWNDLHRAVGKNWGDIISSYQCSPGIQIRLCKNDQWGGSCGWFSGSDSDIHNNGFGDSISSITW